MVTCKRGQDPGEARLLGSSLSPTLKKRLHFDHVLSLPFIHTICPLQEDGSGEDIISKLLVGLQRALRGVAPPLPIVEWMWIRSCSLAGKSK